MFQDTDAKTPEEYIASLEESKKEPIKKLHQLIRETVPKLDPYIISGMIGYGSYHYKSKSGKEGDWFIIGLSSRKNYISIYICSTKEGKYLAEDYKKDLPKAKIGKSCITFTKLEDIDLEVLKKLFKEAEHNPGLEN